MSWYDKHEQDKEDREDTAVHEEARALGGCGNCKYARYPRKLLANAGVEIVVDCYGKTLAETAVNIGLGASCSWRRT